MTPFFEHDRDHRSDECDIPVWDAVIGSRIATQNPAEAVAIALVVGLVDRRLRRAIRRGGLDTSAQVRRRQRLEAEDFARRLPDADVWVPWTTAWLMPPPLASARSLVFKVIRIGRRYGLSRWRIELLVAAVRLQDRASSAVRSLRRWRWRPFAYRNGGSRRA